MRLPREADLAAQLGLSRSSLREAVRALSATRVLEVRQGDGTFVSSLEPGELLQQTSFATDLMQGRTVLELFEVRRLLEPEAAALTALRGDTAAKNSLRFELDHMFEAGDDAEKLVDADAAFHDVIATAPGNAVLCLPCGASRRGPCEPDSVHGMVVIGERLDRARAEHTLIYEAIAAGEAILLLSCIDLLTHIASNAAWLREHLGDSEGIPLDGA
jgi:GntR family transcriptional repressor for pyruvate dehydrogenase complex